MRIRCRRVAFLFTDRTGERPGSGDLGTVIAHATGTESALIASLSSLLVPPASVVLRGIAPNGDSRIVFGPTSLGISILGQ